MKKKHILVIVVCIICFAFVTIRQAQTEEKREQLKIQQQLADELLQVALGINVNDIENIEVVVFPRRDGMEYRELHKVEYQTVVDLLHESHGTYVAEPETVDGEVIYYYITLSNGIRHRFGNNSIYYIIDGSYYKVDDDWLSTWPEEKVDSLLPEGFCY